MIETHQLTKRDGDTTAVEDLSVTVVMAATTGIGGSSNLLGLREEAPIGTVIPPR